MAVFLRPGRYAERSAVNHLYLAIRLQQRHSQFIFGTQLITLDTSGSTIRTPVFVLALALADCVLYLYTFFLINDYGEHKFANTMISKEKYARK